MKVLIVDDEAPARSRLRTLLQSVGDHEVVGEAATGEQALDACQQLAPDLVLLDIRMPGMDGLEAAARLSLAPRPPAVVFVTAYGDHALKAFETEAVDYLLKPVRRERLAEALKRACRLNRAQIEALSAVEPEVDPSREHLLCRRRGNLELIPLDEVRYFQADQKYVTVNHLGGEDLIEDSLKRLEQEFGERFVRVHRNALVAQEFIGGLERVGNQYSLRVRDTEVQLEVSRRHLPQLKALLRRLSQ